MCPWPPQEVLATICERDLCAWVIEPGNTLSNVAYLIVGVWILLRTPRPSPVYWFGLVAIAVAIASSLFHATGMDWTHYGDFLAVYLLTGVMTALNLGRWLDTPLPVMKTVAIVLPTVLLGTLLLFPAAAVWIFILAAPCCAIEARLALLRWREVDYRYYLFAWVATGAAVVAWAVDGNLAVCRPEWHGLTGHSLWHVLSAGAMYLNWRFYMQFIDKKDPGSTIRSLNRL